MLAEYKYALIEVSGTGKHIITAIRIPFLMSPNADLESELFGKERKKRILNFLMDMGAWVGTNLRQYDVMTISEAAGSGFAIYLKRPGGKKNWLLTHKFIVFKDN